MKRYLLIFLFIIGAATLFAAPEEELIIEMSGDKFVQVKQVPSMWDRTAPQLIKQWRGKTRENILYAMPVVSDKDRIVQGKAEYALVEYYNGKDFRKFLFKAETPQTLLTVAATPADVLAVNKKYAVNIGLDQSSFENAYAGQATAQHSDALEDAVLYQLSYRDINTPKAQLNWFLFENGQLQQTFYTQAQKDAFVKKRREEQADVARQMQADMAAAQQAAAQNTAKNNPPQKALLSGGTAYDQAYMPRVTNPNPFLMQGNTSGKK